MLHLAVLDDYQNIANQYTNHFAALDATKVQVTIFNDHLSDEAALIDRLKPFHIISAMRERTPFPRRVLEQLPNLKLLITTGLANVSVDDQACKDLGIAYSGTRLAAPANPDQITLNSTGETTWCLILALAKNLHVESANVRSGGWQTTVGRDLRGSTLGLVGLGKIGKEMVPVAEAFGMKVLAWSQNLTDELAAEIGVQRVGTLLELCEQSD